jgi:hypothetical protein
MPDVQMKNYLSFGGGVNSVAMLLLFHELEIEHEAVYTWMPDWPETHEYLLLLESKGYSVTVIFPKARGHWNLYNYLWDKKIRPVTIRGRRCTFGFKVATLHKYFQKPCFAHIAIDLDESHRAKMRYTDGIENRFPLLEHGMSRDDCERKIKMHGLPLPARSNCFFCPYQRKAQWQQLRRMHPDLYCKAINLEKRIAIHT